MAFKKHVSLVLMVMILMSSWSFNPVYAQNDKDYRNVYLHAAGNPAETLNVSTVYLGDNTNVLLAVDNPNKGDYDADLDLHLEPQYDLNGYTVNFYFDPSYFDYALESSAPIVYRSPNEEWDSNTPNIDDEPQGGVYVHKHGSGTKIVNGKEYKTAYITVLFSGTYLMQKPDSQLWYNLCALPLKPLKTGLSEVFIDVDGNSDHTLELLSKNVDNYSPTFSFDTVNGGFHQINIKDKAKPTAPVASPLPGNYTQAQTVTLTADADCDVFYSLDGVNFLEYLAPIEIESTATIKSYAQRKIDGKKSNTVTYEYKILPSVPFLFSENAGGNKELLPNIYSDYSNFRVYVSDSNVFAGIADDSEVYYTFSKTVSAENIVIGSNPKTEWVKVGKTIPYLDITETVTVRLITKKVEEYSEVAWYYLGVKPDVVTTSRDSGEYDDKISVTLTTQTSGSQIYYTTDGSDPRNNGIVYAGFPLTLYKDTTLRVAAKYGDVFGDVSSYYYVFIDADSYAVDAFYPSGVYEGSVNVTLSSLSSDYTIHYTTDGTNWIEYAKGTILSIAHDTTIQAYSMDGGGNRGETYEFIYKIKPLEPIFSPETTQFTNAGVITIYSAEIGNNYELYYTTDGSDPITNGIKVNGDSITLPITKYTVISAVTKKDNQTFSNVVAYSYDIVTTKPLKPLTTLTSGIYTKAIDGENDLTTKFLPVQSGIKIYYSVAYKSDGNYPPQDPMPGLGGTFEYIPGEDIQIKGETIIKAVAVNGFGVKSDIGIFSYTVVPEAPKTAPGGTIYGELPVVLVEGVEGSTIHYEINGVVNQFVLDGGNTFYLDTATGNAYKDADLTQSLGNTSSEDITAPANLEIYAELGLVESERNRYRYNVSNNPLTLIPPYANKASGTYEAIAIDSEDNILEIKLYSLNHDSEIEYMESNNGIWITYSESIKIKGDTVLQLRAVKDGKYSGVVSYVYTFNPLAPVIELSSGRYSDTEFTKIALDGRAPSDKNYTIMYRRNGDKSDVRYTGAEIQIDHSLSLKAYVVDDDSEKKSSNAINYYIIDSSIGIEGSVYLGTPYDQGSRYSAHTIVDQPYSQGIRLLTGNQNATINYYYSYKTTDGTTLATNNLVYGNIPILVTASIAELSITAWLTDENDNEIEGSRNIFPLEIVHLKVPVTSLAETGEIEFASGTKYTIINDYPDNDEVILYYTTDSSDPADEGNVNRKAYAGEELSITGTTTVKTVYFSACGDCAECKDDNVSDCWYGVYGKTGQYKYTVPTVIRTGGGGGGSYTPPKMVDNTRKYTEDIFGNESPTHIGYINGYPDGSVMPNGKITREEVASIIYRIKNRTYDAPFETTGTAFADVPSDRWSVTAIEYLSHHGVILGYPGGMFEPAQKLTRAEFASLISRFTELEYTSAENVFSDIDDSLWAYKDILALYENGLIDGYEDGTFQPQNEITRAEVMSVVNRLLGRNPSKEYVKSLNYNPFIDLESSKWYYVTVLEATITHNYYLDDDGVETKWEDFK